MSLEGQAWFRENAARFSGQILFDEPLWRHTYYRIGGPAAVFAIPKSIEDLFWLAEGIRNTGIRLFVMGRGSNLLVSDSGFPGLVVRTTQMNQEIGLIDQASEKTSEMRLRTGGSVVVSVLLRKAAQAGWGGLEFLSGIPGAVGGVIAMNAGTYLGYVQHCIRKVETFSLLDDWSDQPKVPTVYEGEQLQFQYRKNLFLPQGSMVWSAEWEIRQERPEQVKSLMDQIYARRKTTQPIDLPSCGSVFKNPKESGFAAWQVIERLGLRGYRFGGAQFSDKHSNFIINLGDAKATDVQTLILLAKFRAENELGIHLEEEVIFLS